MIVTSNKKNNILGLKKKKFQTECETNNSFFFVHHSEDRGESDRHVFLANLQPEALTNRKRRRTRATELLKGLTKIAQHAWVCADVVGVGGSARLCLVRQNCADHWLVTFSSGDLYLSHRDKSKQLIKQNNLCVWSKLAQMAPNTHCKYEITSLYLIYLDFSFNWQRYLYLHLSISPDEGQVNVAKG